jgi:CRISPR-associated protein Cmr1
MRASLRVVLSSPLSAGYYDPRVLDRRFYIRPSSVKGLWKWWARAFVAGILYERGCLRGRSVGPFLAVPDWESAERVVRHVGETLGLGMPSFASKFTLETAVIREPWVYGASGQKYIRGPRGNIFLHRLYLTSLGGRTEYAVGGEFEISVEGPDDVVQFNTAVSILLTALTLGCVGKGGRKGLGCLDVVSPGPPVGKNIGELIEYARGRLGHLIRDRCGAPGGMPPMPALTPKYSEVYEVAGISLEDLHNFFYRPHRAVKLTGTYFDEVRNRLVAWAMGLPRGQARQGTGYFSKAERRASTVMAAYHERHRYSASVVTLIKSADWPAEIEWSGGGSARIRVDERVVEEAYDVVKNVFVEYVQKLGGSVKRVWP